MYDVGGDKVFWRGAGECLRVGLKSNLTTARGGFVNHATDKVYRYFAPPYNALPIPAKDRGQRASTTSTAPPPLDLDLDLDLEFQGPSHGPSLHMAPLYTASTRWAWWAA